VQKVRTPWDKKPLFSELKEVKRLSSKMRKTAIDLNCGNGGWREGAGRRLVRAGRRSMHVISLTLRYGDVMARAEAGESACKLAKRYNTSMFVYALSRALTDSSPYVRWRTLKALANNRVCAEALESYLQMNFDNEHEIVRLHTVKELEFARPEFALEHLDAVVKNWGEAGYIRGVAQRIIRRLETSGFRRPEPRHGAQWAIRRWENGAFRKALKG
jgi:hypothetical protein